MAIFKFLRKTAPVVSAAATSAAQTPTPVAEISPLEKITQKHTFHHSSWAAKGWDRFQSSFNAQYAKHLEKTPAAAPLWLDTVVPISVAFLDLFKISQLNTPLADEITQTTNRVSQQFSTASSELYQKLQSTTSAKPSSKANTAALQLAAGQVAGQAAAGLLEAISFITEAMMDSLMVAGADASSYNDGPFDFLYLEVVPTLETLTRHMADHSSLTDSLAKTQSLFVNQWFINDKRDVELNISGADILSMMTSSALSGFFPQSFCDDKQMLHPHQFALALRILEAEAMTQWYTSSSDHKAATDTAFEFLEGYKPVAERLGRTLGQFEALEPFLLQFCSLLNHTHATGAPHFPHRNTRYNGDHSLASYAIIHWMLKEIIIARPAILTARNERGHNILSLFNEALILAAPQKAGVTHTLGSTDKTLAANPTPTSADPKKMHPALLLAENSLCEMIKASPQMESIIPIQDPYQSAFSDKARAALTDLQAHLPLYTPAAPLVPVVATPVTLSEEVVQSTSLSDSIQEMPEDSSETLTTKITALTPDAIDPKAQISSSSASSSQPDHEEADDLATFQEPSKQRRRLLSNRL